MRQQTKLMLAHRYQLLLNLACGVAALVTLSVVVTWAQKPLAAPDGEPTAAVPLLKTNSDLDRLLTRADQFVGDGRYDLAIALWQKVIDTSGNTVMSRDEWTRNTSATAYRKYQSVAGQVERTLAQLPAEELRKYRIRADGEAAAILEETSPDRREEALTEVVKRYFLSSHGDDASFELACRHIDQHRYVRASGLLWRIVNDYPDTQIPRSDLLLRLAFTTARLGNAKEAERLLQEVKLAPEKLPRHILVSVQDDLETAADGTSAGVEPNRRYPIALGNPARTGQMPALEPGALKSPLSQAWQFPLAERVQELSQKPANERRLPGHFSRNMRMPPPPDSAESWVAQWQERQWVPTAEILTEEERLYVKTLEDIVCLDSRTGNLVWRSAHANAFRVDPLSMALRSGRGVATKLPAWPTEVQLFGDRIWQSMSIVGNRIYSLEGDSYDRHSPRRRRVGMNARKMLQANNQHRTGAPWLVAYESTNGLLKWRRRAGAGESDNQTTASYGFLAAPVPHADQLLVPVSKGGTIWLYALDANEPPHLRASELGQTVWKTYLCDEPVDRINYWSPVGLAVDGGDAYVATGAGVVFAVDAFTGGVRWAVQYRQETLAPRQRVHLLSRLNVGKEAVGWSQDYAIPYGHQLVVIPSDSKIMFGLDRRTGELLWESPSQAANELPTDYCLGVVQDRLYLAGRRVAACYDLKSDGLFLWQTPLEESHGRGVLTTNGLYLPVEDRVVRLDLETGKPVQEAPVVSATQQPTGNLFADGTRIYTVGFSHIASSAASSLRLQALQDLQSRMDELARLIADGDGQSQWERFHLYVQLQDHASALDDLRGTHAKLLDSEGPLAANLTMFRGVSLLQLPQRDPTLSVELLSEMPAVVLQENVDSPQLNPTERQFFVARGRAVEATLSGLRAASGSGRAEGVLALAPLCDHQHLEIAARAAIQEVVDAADTDLLRRTLANDNSFRRQLAIWGLAKANPEVASVALQQTLETDQHDKVKLAAAIELLNQENRSALQPLASLLMSPDIYVRVQSARALRAVTGQQFGFVAYDSENERSARADAWHEWLANEGNTVALQLPIEANPILLGRTLVCELKNNSVAEFDTAGTEVWRQQVSRPWAVQGLPNGHRLLCSNTEQKIKEYDTDGNLVWSSNPIEGKPTCMERLPNGDTLVSTISPSMLFEINYDSKQVVWKQQLQADPYHIDRLDNGNTLMALATSRVVEINRNGDEVWAVNVRSPLKQPFSVQRLANGHTLIAYRDANRVVEIDRSGKRIVWQKSGLTLPTSAQRLPNGNTLIVDQKGIHEFDTEHKTVRTTKGDGFLRAFRY